MFHATNITEVIKMKKKQAIIALIILIVIAVFGGLILVNKGDGPVTGVMLSAKPAADENAFGKTEADKTNYLISVMEYNKFVEKYNTKIPENNDLYAHINLVECRKGIKVKVKWLLQNTAVKEEEKPLLTDQKGIISYELEGEKVKKGSYVIEIYYADKKILTENFIVD